MDIGPWQEFKLAKILQLKDKVDREHEAENRLPQDQAAGLPGQTKAYSVGNRFAGNYTTHSE